MLWMLAIVAGSTPRRAARSAMTCPYSTVTTPPVFETYFPLSSIKPTNCPCDTRMESATSSWTRGDASAFSDTFRASWRVAAATGAASALALLGSFSWISPVTSMLAYS